MRIEKLINLKLIDRKDGRVLLDADLTDVKPVDIGACETESKPEKYKPQEYFYMAEPIFEQVSKGEFDNFIKNYPRKLDCDVTGICEPPHVSYNDFELANQWPHSTVASYSVYSDDPEHYYYDPNPTFSIMANYAEVFGSKTGMMV